MAQVKNLWLVLETSNTEYSGTSSSLTLTIGTGSGPQTFSTKDQVTSLNTLQQGAPAIFSWPCNFDTSEIENAILSIDGDDAWLPATIFTTGQDTDGACHLITSDPAWPSDECFSTDQTDCARAQTQHELNVVNWPD